MSTKRGIRAAIAVLSSVAWLGFMGVSSGQTVLQTFYVPFPEDQVFRALETIDCFGCGAGGGIGGEMRSTISIVPSLTNTIVYYDHW